MNDMHKKFTTTDLVKSGWAPKIFLGAYGEDLVHDPLPWQKRGLQETASGYGAKLTSCYKIDYNGRLYRVYHTRYGNSSSAWFIAKGVKIYLQ